MNGYTEAGAVLTLNGEPVELTQNYFNKKITLAGGENTITLIAEDAVGISRYIQRQSPMNRQKQ